MTRRQGKISKQERREERERVAKKRRLRKRVIQYTVFGALGLSLGAWSFDRSGPQELVEAEVISTQQYPHASQGAGTHFHTRVRVRIEDSVEAVIERGPTVQRGEKIQVWIRRGRISNRPYFQGMPAAADALGFP